MFRASNEPIQAYTENKTNALYELKSVYRKVLQIG
jgi:hypothetical protein